MIGGGDAQQHELVTENGEIQIGQQIYTNVNINAYQQRQQQQKQ